MENSSSDKLEDSSIVAVDDGYEEFKNSVIHRETTSPTYSQENNDRYNLNLMNYFKSNCLK